MGQGDNTSVTDWCAFATHPTVTCTQKRCSDSATGYCDQVPSFAAAGRLEPDAGGLNIEGVAWDPRSRSLLFGLRGPADPGSITVIRVPVDAVVAPWTTEALGAPSMLRARLPRSKAKQGIRDISYDEQTGDFVVIVGRSTSEDRRTLSALHVERQQRQRPTAGRQISSIDEAGRRCRLRERRRSPDSSSSTTGAGMRCWTTPGVVSRSRGWNRVVPGGPVACRPASCRSRTSPSRWSAH